MNAIKHGLDARTLILPGEDEAAYRARLDAWTAVVGPRDAEEQAQVEEAVRLSWQLDRADRAQAALLTERHRRAAEDQAARPGREAAEAARVGETLLAGPPEVPAPRGLPHDEIAGRSFRALFHPDDPDRPDRLLRRLEATAAGCRWLLDRWSELRAILADDPAAWWGSEHRVRAIRLRGKDPFDAADDPEVGAVYLCSFTMDPAGPRVYSELADRVTKTEFNRFVDRLKGRRAGHRVPPDRESARQQLLAWMDVIMNDLRRLEAVHVEREAAPPDPARLAFDDSPQGGRIRRLQSRLSNQVFRAMGVLLTIQHRRTPNPGQHVPVDALPMPEVVAPGPATATGSVRMRNEPNEPPTPIPNEPNQAAASLRSEPNEPDEPVRNEPNEPASAMRNEPNKPCAPLRNEPNESRDAPGSGQAGRPVIGAGVGNEPNEPGRRPRPGTGPLDGATKRTQQDRDERAPGSETTSSPAGSGIQADDPADGLWQTRSRKTEIRERRDGGPALPDPTSLSALRPSSSMLPRTQGRDAMHGRRSRPRPVPTRQTPAGHRGPGVRLAPSVPASRPQGTAADLGLRPDREAEMMEGTCRRVSPGDAAAVRPARRHRIASEGFLP